MKKLHVLLHIRKVSRDKCSYIADFKYSEHKGSFKKLADCDAEIQKLAAESNPFSGLDFKDDKHFSYYDIEEKKVILGNLCNCARATRHIHLLAIDSFTITNMFDVEMALSDFKFYFGCDEDELGKVFIKVLNNTMEEYNSEDDFTKYSMYWEDIMARV